MFAIAVMRLDDEFLAIRLDGEVVEIIMHKIGTSWCLRDLIPRDIAYDRILEPGEICRAVLPDVIAMIAFSHGRVRAHD